MVEGVQDADLCLAAGKNNGVKNIWIAAGTYKEGQTVNMVAGVNVYGELQGLR